MGTGYTRNDTSNNIADGNVINASDLDGEFDAIESAFGTSGHTHDGTAAEGGAITKVGPVQDIVVSATNLNPKTNNTIDLGTASLKYKDAHFQGSIDTDGVITAATFEPDGDTAAGDNAAIGYTAAEGLILTGQGSTSDITLKNDADAVVFTVPTGTDDILFPDNAKAMFGSGSDLQIYHDGSNSYIEDTATGGLILKSNGPSIAFQKGDGSELFAVSTSGGFTATDGSTITVNDNSATLSLVSTDTDASQGPILRLSRDVVGAASDVIGTIHYYAQDVAGNDTQYAEIEGRIGDATNGAEDGELVVSTMLAGTSRARLKFDSTEAVFNDGSLDLDFRVESNGNANMLFVDGGNNRVGVGTNTPATSLSVVGTGTFDSAFIGHDTSQVVGGNEAIAQIIGVDGGAGLSITRHQASTGGPSLRFGKSRVSTKGDVTIVQDDDQLGRIEFNGADGTDLVTKGAKIEAFVDGTPSADDMPTRLVFSTTADGANAPTERMVIDSTGDVQITRGTEDQSLTRTLTIGGARNATGNGFAEIDFQNYDNNNSSTDYVGSRISAQLGGSGGSAEGGLLSFQAGTGTAAPVEVFKIQDNEVVVNDPGNDVNFRVESSINQNAFIVDAGANFIGMHTPTIAGLNGYTERVRIASDGNNLGGSLIMSANNGGRTGNESENDIVFYDTDAATTNNQGLGNLRWYGLDASGAGAGYKIGIKGRGQGDGSAFLEFYTSSTSTNYVKVLTATTVSTSPGADNVRDLGASATRWDDVFATNGTINTSDERLKQQVASLTADEMNAAKAISALFKTYKWNDKVAEKGDNARIHSGVIAQQVKAAMEANSLDPMKYAFMCWNEFYEKEMSGEDIATPYVEAFEVDDPEIPEGATYVDRYSIRYSELMSFIHAATEQRLASIESRLDALEAE